MFKIVPANEITPCSSLYSSFVTLTYHRQKGGGVVYTATVEDTIHAKPSIFSQSTP
mgnify:CR=1 FL=1